MQADAGGSRRRRQRGSCSNCPPMSATTQQRRDIAEQHVAGDFNEGQPAAGQLVEPDRQGGRIEGASRGVDTVCGRRTDITAEQLVGEDLVPVVKNRLTRDEAPLAAAGFRRLFSHVCHWIGNRYPILNRSAVSVRRAANGYQAESFGPIRPKRRVLPEA